MSERHDLPEYHDGSGIYEIRLKGHLGGRWVDRFEGLTITLEENGDTLLSGPVADQAVLHGLLKKFRDLGIPLVSVNRAQFSETHPYHSKKEKKMRTYRMNAVMGGALYFLGTVFGVLGAVVGGEVLSSLVIAKPLVGVDMLGLVATNSSRLTGGAFLTFMMGVSLVAMTVFLYPLLRKDSQELAMGLVLFRGALEGTCYLVSTLGILALIALANDYTAAGATSAALQSMGNVLYQLPDLSGTVGTMLFVIGTTCLCLSFYRTRLIPRWLTVWGLIGMVPYMAYGLLHFFHMDNGIGFYLQMVTAPQELVMGLWLVIKGFNPSAIAALSTKTDEKPNGSFLRVLPTT